MIPGKKGVQLRDCMHFQILQDDQGPVGCTVQFMYIQLMLFFGIVRPFDWSTPSTTTPVRLA